MNEFEQSVNSALMNLGDHAIGTPDRIFVSGLPFCLRKAVFLRVFHMNIEANVNMARGTMYHLIIPNIIDRIGKGSKGYNFPEIQYEVECSGQYDGFKIVGHCDVALGRGKEEMFAADMVEEWKFSRMSLRGGDDLPSYYMSQVNMYAYLMKAPLWRLVIVHPDKLTVTMFDGNVGAQAADIMADRAETVHKVFTQKDHPIHLLGGTYDAIIKGAHEPYLRPLLDEIVYKLPEGPEYSFECKSRSGKCPFLNICHGKNALKS
ncbi:MAG: hypothetical protein U9R75_11300 [Candidatus Thermoplasmatota archaeon]|nr:hypothetical protein [Candidatus Thermoplasmatota archaeon]